MSWLVSIDESGNLGKDSRFFTMSAIIVRRANHLKKVYKKIPKTTIELKFYNTSENIISIILDEFANAEVKIAYIAVDKHNHKNRHYGKRGNVLYTAVLSDLLDSIGEVLGPTELEILIDKSSFVSQSELRSIALMTLTAHGCIVKRIDKKDSEQSPCIQVADFIAGAVFRYYEYDEKHLFGKITKKVVVARTD